MAKEIKEQGIMVSPDAADHAYVDWGAIFAGAVIATAISFVLLTFSSGVGLSLTDPLDRDGFSLQTLGILTALWVIFVQVMSFGVGGYITGRVRTPAFGATEDEVAVRDGVHGVAMWALAALAGAYLATSGIGSVASTATTAVSTTASAATEAATTASKVWFNQLSEEDRNEIAAIVQRRTGVSEVEARQQVQETFKVPPAVENVSKSDVVRTADRMAFWAGMMAFLVAASTLVAGVVAWWAADLGGHHRDSNRPLSLAYRWRE